MRETTEVGTFGTAFVLKSLSPHSLPFFFKFGRFFNNLTFKTYRNLLIFFRQGFLQLVRKVCLNRLQLHHIKVQRTSLKQTERNSTFRLVLTREKEDSFST